MSIGIALDIDGVLLRGKHIIPQARDAVQYLLSSSRIQTLFVTNGGGVTEDRKADDLSNKLNIHIKPNQIVLSHTPFRSLVQNYRDSSVLVVGGDSCVDVAKHYGFNKIVTSAHIHAYNSDIYPAKSIGRHNGSISASNDHELIEAAFVFADSCDWGLDIQVMTDLLLRYEDYNDKAGKRFLIYACNADLVYNDTHPSPRYTQGAFITAFQALHHRYSKKNANIKFYGKPFKTQYEYVEEIFRKNALDSGLQIPTKFYGVGDNPASDVRGANNAGEHWTSVLVRTGLFSGSDNDERDPADFVEHNVLEAVYRILDLEEIPKPH